MRRALYERRMEERKVRLMFGCKGHGIGRDDGSTSKRNMIEESGARWPHRHRIEAFP